MNQSLRCYKTAEQFYYLINQEDPRPTEFVKWWKAKKLQ